MPQNLTETATFDTPITVPQNTDPATAESVVVPFQAVTNRTKYLKNELDTRIVADEFTYPTPKAKVKELGIMALGAGADGWSPVLGRVESTKDTHPAFFDLDLPGGCVVTGIDVIVTPGAARSSPNRMTAVLTRINADYSTPGSSVESFGTSAEDDGTTGAQLLQQTGLSVTLSSRDSKAYAIRVFSGNTGSSAADKIHGVRVHYNDPGPRNV